MSQSPYIQKEFVLRSAVTAEFITHDVTLLFNLLGWISSQQVKIQFVLEGALLSHWREKCIRNP